MVRFKNISVTPDRDPENEAELRALLVRRFRIKPQLIDSVKISRRSIDARKKNDVRILYTLDVTSKREEKLLSACGSADVSSVAEKTEYVVPKPEKTPANRPVVVGFGPAGMYAALVLSMAGLKPIVLERGQDADTRKEKVQRFWNGGALDTECNVQFGEGGAGTFSDGKLTTGIKSDKIAWVLRVFHEAGAPESILYDAKPHIGTDVLIEVVKNIRRKILSLGGEVLFGCRLTSFSEENGSLTGITYEKDGETHTISCDNMIFAVGHSARDTFRMIYEKGLFLEPKPFSMGVRVEHLQKKIDESQYGKFAGHKRLPVSDYKLSGHFPDGTSAYTFCMCPGGTVVAAASQSGGVVTNGMSNHARDLENANAAVLVSLTPEDFPDKSPLGGVYWQEEIERRAFLCGGGNYHAPAQLLGDFMKGVPSRGPRSVTPTYRPGVTYTDLGEVFPKKITDTLKNAFRDFDRRLKGFADPEAVLTAPETRSSSPVRVRRDENYMASVKGIFPCGEGSGYAGGITSAAVDGIRCAEALLKRIDAE